MIGRYDAGGSRSIARDSTPKFQRKPIHMRQSIGRRRLPLTAYYTKAAKNKTPTMQNIRVWNMPAYDSSLIPGEVEQDQIPLRQLLFQRGRRSASKLPWPGPALQEEGSRSSSLCMQTAPSPLLRRSKATKRIVRRWRRIYLPIRNLLLSVRYYLQLELRATNLAQRRRSRQTPNSSSCLQNYDLRWQEHLVPPTQDRFLGIHGTQRRGWCPNIPKSRQSSSRRRIISSQ